ncbi:FecR family protein [Mucilaginibacter pankratovii]|nr:FecR family protein [Mucilaginibacter pankratovii]
MNGSNNRISLTELFQKYLDGRCSLDETRQLLNYFESEPNESQLRSLIRMELGYEDSAESNASSERAIQQVKENILQEIKENTDSKSSGTLFPRWLKIAAFWLILVGTGALIYRSYFMNNSSGDPKLYTLLTKAGEHKILTLSDGTKIWLSPSSSLQYPDQLTGNLREVKLEGEAFFEVAKDKKHPFVIHSGQMDTRVVGTSFNIQSYKIQAKYTVTVVTGIVNVSAPGALNGKRSNVVLRPNQRSEFNPQTGTLISLNYFEAKQMLNRKNGILNYDGVSVPEVVAELTRYYRVPILTESKSKNCLCYGEFNTNRPLAIVLEQLAAAINAKVITQKDKYILKGGCEE